MIAVLAALLGLVVVSGCGGDTSTPGKSGDGSKPPSEVAMLYVNGFRGDVAGVKVYNPNSSLTEDYLQTLGKQAAEGFAQGLGVTFTQEQLAAIGKAYTDALTRIEAKVGDEQVDGDRATVTFEIRGLDMAGALKERVDTMPTPPKGSEATAYSALLVDSLGGAALVAEPDSYSMTLNRSGNGTWSPDAVSGSGLVRALVRWS